MRVDRLISANHTPRERLQTPRQRNMILTNCAACAAPLAHNAPRCIRCHTRYCEAEACNLPFVNRLQLACNVANSLIGLKHFTEAKSFLRQPLDTAVSVLDANHVLVLQLRVIFGQAQLHDAKTRGEVVEAEKVLADAHARQRRVCGPSHPDTRFAQTVLETARAALDA